MQQRLCFVVLMLGGALGCASNASISSGGVVAGVEAADASLDGTAVGFPQYPSLSPDGSTVVFAWAGDLWSVGSEGGLASRLTAHPAEEGRSAFSPDGTRLAFESDRDGTQNLYVMPLVARNGSFVGGAISRVTVSDRSQSLSGFSPDGSSLVFSSRAEPSIYRHARMYVAPMDGGPVRRLTDAFGMSPSFRDGPWCSRGAIRTGSDQSTVDQAPWISMPWTEEVDSDGLRASRAMMGTGISCRMERLSSFRRAMDRTTSGVCGRDQRTTRAAG